MSTNNSKNTIKKIESNHKRLLGVLNLISSEEFEKNLDELDYLIKLIETDDEELENIVIGVYSDKNSLKEIVPIDIVIITSAKTYIINVDYEDPITKEVKTKVHSQETGWKRLKLFRKINQKEIIMHRLLVLGAIYCEQLNGINISSKYEFEEEILKHIPAMNYTELAKQIRAEGKSNVDGSEVELDITDDMNTLSIIKFIHNKLKNDTLRINLLGVEDDMTYITLENKTHILKFEIGLIKKTVTLVRKTRKEKEREQW